MVCWVKYKINYILIYASSKYKNLKNQFVPNRKYTTSPLETNSLILFRNNITVYSGSQTKYKSVLKMKAGSKETQRFKAGVHIIFQKSGSTSIFYMPEG
jgi:hypothetical protein